MGTCFPVEKSVQLWATQTLAADGQAVRHIGVLRVSIACREDVQEFIGF